MIHNGSTTTLLRTAAFALAAAAACSGVFPGGAAGQSLHLAELFAEQGRTGDARAEVMAWFEIRGDAATDEELQHFLWLRGRLAEDRTAALRDLEGLVDEHPGGPYTAAALVWLADAAVERGDEGAAMAYRAQVVRNFPDSEPAARAREWLRARGLEVDEPAPSPAVKDSLPSARAPAEARPAPVDTTPRKTAPTDTATPEQVAADTVPSPPAASVATDSVPAVAVASDPPPAPPEPADTVTPAADPPPPAADSAAAPAPEPEPETAAAPPTPAVEEIAPGPAVPGAAEAGAFAVQIGAFRNPDGAAGLVDELIQAGFDARLVQVPANTLLRVRVGRFATSDAAAAELQRVRDGGYDGAVVDDARRETVVSR